MKHEEKRGKEHYSYKFYRDPSHARQFEATRFAGEIGRFFDEIQQREIFSFLEGIDTTDFTVLDLGAGGGRISLPFYRKQFPVVSVDASAQMLGVFKEKLEGESEGEILLVQGDAHQLPFSDGAFELVVSARMILHVIDWKSAIRQMCRVSSRLVIFDIPSITSVAWIHRQLLKVRSIFRDDTQLYNVFSLKRDIIPLLEDCGFELIAYSKELVLPFKLHRKLNNPGFTRRVEGLLGSMGLTRLFGSPITLLARRKA